MQIDCRRIGGTVERDSIGCAVVVIDGVADETTVGCDDAALALGDTVYWNIGLVVANVD